MKVAIVHEWLTNYWGSERVLEQMLLVFPHADLFCTVDFLPEDQRDCIQNKSVKTSFIQKLPFARTKYRQYLPITPLAIEQLDVSGYDLVISSSHAVAKGVLTGPDQLHICMCYSPIRYAWDLQHQYLAESGLNKGIKGWLTRRMLQKVRLWDVHTANRVDKFIAISQFVGRRIMKAYRRDSTVIYPPVDVEKFTLHEAKEDYYFTASRMVPYKRIDLIVESFSQMPDNKLVVIGDGPEYKKIRAKAGKNVTLLGYQDNQVMLDYMQRAKAFVFAAEEDFGIIPIEAQACGTPVIAYGKGGAVETVRGLDHAQPTGIFFHEQTVPALTEAVALFERENHRIKPADCRANALRFAPERFRKEFAQFVERAWEEFAKQLGESAQSSIQAAWERRGQM